MELVSWFTIVGAAGQCAFGARMLLQWLLSEKAGRVCNPALFWWLSLLGSVCMSVYGFLRSDAAILLSQVLAYYVYVYNLYLKQQLRYIKTVGTVVICIFPLAILVWMLTDKAVVETLFLNDEHIPTAWLIYGGVSYSLFTIRYLYQSYVSHHAGKSLLPAMFWYISILAAVSVQIYGIYRADIVLIISQAGGLIVYIRNIMLGRRKPSQGPKDSPSAHGTH